LIATGGMGSVYLAEQQGISGFKKTVAIKTIRTDLLENKNTFDMFISEAKLVADLIHENIAQVYNLSEANENVFIVMEYIKGINLSRLIKKHKSFKINVDTEMAAFICSRIARALSYAHNKSSAEGEPLQIVHRDVTPGNILIDTLGVVKLTDFGIAKGITMGNPDEKKVLMGKYPYMSPEQVRLEGTNGQSDIFTLGLLFYELLTMKKIFPVKTRDELLQMMNVYEPLPPHKINKNVSEHLSNIVMQMLEMDPAKRTSSARKLVIQLETYMYDKGYGPTNEKLALYMKDIFKRVNG
jgi:eukaryotic-like serine/threonine-protein kinase